MSDGKRSMLPDVDYKNMSLVMLFYIALYSFLAGFYALMLKGVMATSKDGTHTLLWTFLVLGIIFTVAVSTTIFVSQYQEKQKKKQQEGDPPCNRKNHTINLEGLMNDDTLHCV